MQDDEEIHVMIKEELIHDNSNEQTTQIMITRNSRKQS